MHHATYNCILSSWGLARKLAVVPSYEYDKMGGVSIYTNQFIGIKIHIRTGKTGKEESAQSGYPLIIKSGVFR